MMYTENNCIISRNHSETAIFFIYELYIIHLIIEKNHHPGRKLTLDAKNLPKHPSCNNNYAVPNFDMLLVSSNFLDTSRIDIHIIRDVKTSYLTRYVLSI